MSVDLLSGPELTPKSGQPKNMVILLHGVGANGDDLIALAEHWQPYMPDTVFLSPNAPFPYDMAPVGYQWFSLQSRDFDFIKKGVDAARVYLNNYIDAKLAEYNVEEENLLIVGFSQGTMMALYEMPRREKRCAGILGYSGMSVDDGRLKEEMNHKMPICLIHGEQDEVVPYQAMIGTHEFLTMVGFEVEMLSCPNLGHSIDMKGLDKGAEFIIQNLYRKKKASA